MLKVKNKKSIESVYLTIQKSNAFRDIGQKLNLMYIWET
jgi:hypothetical protein